MIAAAKLLATCQLDRRNRKKVSLARLKIYPVFPRVRNLPCFAEARAKPRGKPKGGKSFKTRSQTGPDPLGMLELPIRITPK